MWIERQSALQDPRFLLRLTKNAVLEVSWLGRYWDLLLGLSNK
jgi:hypothetical protein